jgi:hypothetical protein
MPVKLTTTVKKIADVLNSINSALLSEFYYPMILLIGCLDILSSKLIIFVSA